MDYNDGRRSHAVVSYEVTPTMHYSSVACCVLFTHCFPTVILRRHHGQAYVHLGTLLDTENVLSNEQFMHLAVVS